MGRGHARGGGGRTCLTEGFSKDMDIILVYGVCECEEYVSLYFFS
jgi:hypothetical protein